MPRNAIVTGSSGLIGSECVAFLDERGWDVHGVDNNMRRDFFGADGDTTWNLERLRASTRRFTHHDLDVWPGGIAAGPDGPEFHGAAGQRGRGDLDAVVREQGRQFRLRADRLTGEDRGDPRLPCRLGGRAGPRGGRRDGPEPSPSNSTSEGR